MIPSYHDGIIKPELLRTSPKKSKILNFKHAQNRKFNEENTVEFTTDDEEMTFEFELEENEEDNIH